MYVLKLDSYITKYIAYLGARGNLLVKALYYQSEDRRFETRWSERMFSNCLILPVALGPGFTQPLTEIITRSRKIMFLGVERGRCARLTTLPTSVSRLSRLKVPNLFWPTAPFLKKNYSPPTLKKTPTPILEINNVTHSFPTFLGHNPLFQTVIRWCLS
jgi:hypothetical protein